jgi:poly(A) polymerase
MTSAQPDEVQRVFGRRKTLAIGASFGVITVLGPKGAGQIDVATFRREAGYSDGRHPDSVTFTNAEQDALRRDFTINGLFFDPVENRVIDYIGGQEDLRLGIVRAIGDPAERIAEDKLRMLRAVRFAARFDFAIEPGTLAAIQQHAHELVIVSAERIAAEMRRIITHPSRARGVLLAQIARLLEVMLPESAALSPDDLWSPESAADTPWRRTLHILHRLERPTFAVALAALLREIPEPEIARRVFERWKLSTDELEGTSLALASEPTLREARQVPWPRLQRLLIAPRIDELLTYGQAVAFVIDRDTANIDFCREKLTLPTAKLNPPPLLTGDDLKQLGIPPGPAYRTILEAVRDAQLEGRIDTRESALQFAESMSEPHSGTC